MSFHSQFHGFIRRLYYSRTTVRGAEQVPTSGPLLVLCLHRNGALDGFVYRAAVPHLTYLIRAKLRYNPIGKLFFNGVEVVRNGDGGTREGNMRMFETCVSHLQGDTPLAIFPEGTSKLGPRHLPFKSGAARIAHYFLEGGKPLTVLPLGIHYECPWAFRSRVEVVVGEPLILESPDLKLGHIKQRSTAALEAVGFNVPDAETHDLAHRLAYIATLGTKHQFFETLKTMEHDLPPKSAQAWKTLDEKMRHRRVLRHQGVPLFPTKYTLAYALLTLLLAVPVLAGALLNLPPLALGFWTGRRFADDTNVIALWRILSGVPAFVVWATLMVVLPLALGQGGAAIAYLALTALALQGWYRLKKLAVASWNGLFHADLQPEALALHSLLLSELSQTESTS
jgi:1-acyl-sn-glycerol-3-phosphate acyltransferase